MADPDSPQTVLGLALDIIRENGLIVVALATLAWQVYSLMNFVTAQDIRWAAQVDKVNSALDMDRQVREQNWGLVREVLSRVDERVKTTERIASDMEEECMVKKAVAEAKGEAK